VQRVLVIGGTGNLGSLIARKVLDKGATLRMLVRPASRGKLAASIANDVEVADSEAGAFKDVYAVISAVQGGPETIIDAQVHYLRAARDAGVRRFIPSDFSLNLFNLADGENINSDWRRAFARQADEERRGMEVVHVLNGAFLDRRVVFGFLGAIDLDKREAYFGGEGSARMQFTTYADTAAYTAEVASHSRLFRDTRTRIPAARVLQFLELASLDKRLKVSRVVQDVGYESSFGAAAAACLPARAPNVSAGPKVAPPAQ
jgi:hypothetical protein